MPIYEGSNGSLNLFYNERLVSSFPLTNKKTFSRYKYQGDYIILKSMNEKLKLKQIIITFKSFCDLIYQRKKNNQAIRKSDHQMFLSCFFGLLKLKQIDEDNILIMKKKKKKKINLS